MPRQMTGKELLAELRSAAADVNNIEGLDAVEREVLDELRGIENVDAGLLDRKITVNWKTGLVTL